MYKLLFSILILSTVFASCSPDADKEVVVKVDYSLVMRQMARPHNLKFREVLEVTITMNTKQHFVDAFFKNAKRIYPSVDFRHYFKWEYGIKAGMSDKDVKKIIRSRCDKAMQRMVDGMESNFPKGIEFVAYEELNHSKLKIYVNTDLSDEELRSFFQSQIDLRFYPTEPIMSFSDLIIEVQSVHSSVTEVETANEEDDEYSFNKIVPLDQASSIWHELQLDFRNGEAKAFARKNHIAELLDSLNNPQFTSNGKFRFMAMSDEERPDMLEVLACLVDVDPGAAVTGDFIKEARAQKDPNSGEWAIMVTLNRTGAEKFAQLSVENVGKKVAVVVNDEIIAAPNIVNPIWDGNVMISGSFNAYEAREMAGVLNKKNWALPCKILSIKAN